MGQTPLDTFREGRATVAAALLASEGFRGVKERQLGQARRLAMELRQAATLEACAERVFANGVGAVALVDLGSQFERWLEAGLTDFEGVPATDAPSWSFFAVVMLELLDDIEQAYPEGLTE